jgi:hypothetical protein
MKDRKKPRNTDFSITQQLINYFGEKKLYNTWKKYGMYKSAEILTEEGEQYVSPYVMRYLSNKFNWKREISNPNLPFVKGILNGKVDAEYYKHVRFKNIPGIPGIPIVE